MLRWDAEIHRFDGTSSGVMFRGGSEQGAQSYLQGHLDAGIARRVDVYDDRRRLVLRMVPAALS
jgi:hypothetical protein